MSKVSFEDLRALANKTSVATVTDVMKPQANQVFIHGLEACQPNRTLFGQAVTVRSLPAREDCMEDTKKEFADRVPSGDPMMHAIKQCGPGRVLVVDSSGHPGVAIGGDTKFAVLATLGGEGLVTDGAIRDQREFREQFQFATYCKGFTPLGGTGRVLFGRDVNIDINCGGVLVRPGDYLFGDDDGVIVIPESQVEQTLNAAVASEQFGLFIREKSVAEKVTYGDIVPNIKKYMPEFLDNADLTPAQKTTLE